MQQRRSVWGEIFVVGGGLMLVLAGTLIATTAVIDFGADLHGYAAALATAAAHQPDDAPAPTPHPYYDLAALALERELTPTATPTQVATMAPTITPIPSMFCEERMRNGTAGDCTWALPTVAPPTVVACQTPLPGADCWYEPPPTSAPLVPPTSGEGTTE